MENTPIYIDGILVTFSFDPDGYVLAVDIPPIKGIYVGGVTFPIGTQIEAAIGITKNLIRAFTGITI